MHRDELDTHKKLGGNPEHAEHRILFFKSSFQNNKEIEMIFFRQKILFWICPVLLKSRAYIRNSVKKYKVEFIY